MGIDFGKTIDAVGDGVKNVGEVAHKSTENFHKKFVSKITPKDGKFGDATKFVAETVPGISEYNAAREGNWKDFAIAAGMDVALIGVTVTTAGLATGPAIAVKVGTEVGITAVKTVLREGTEAVAEKTVKETGELAVKKATIEVGQAIDKTRIPEYFKGQSDIPSFAKNMKSETVTNYQEANQPIRYVETRNQHLNGDVHTHSGVPFVRKIVEMPDGEKIEGVFPEFPHQYEVILDETQYLDSDARQFRAAVNQLGKDIDSNLDLAKKFTPEQVEQIKNGDTPDGYVWHHSEQPGILQLVDKNLHDITGHHGGRYLWGGGSEHR
ncbi:HNH endonuclease [Neobacillus sp. OS1-33]|uniref:HNH endonuclease n=1 Tax=Neobacillus sp. OS1-33 TaxID=3070683 RepID=UPI0027E0F434|nr:HNH endonuclease [Neobacillus sp. OS1-33]WML26330.1 HNH endonuclease [Neobacillus sp. OS1-33]